MSLIKAFFVIIFVAVVLTVREWCVVKTGAFTRNVCKSFSVFLIVYGCLLSLLSFTGPVLHFIKVEMRTCKITTSQKNELLWGIMRESCNRNYPSECHAKTI